ncbi:hypothetical protein DY000_02019248 [Brassica cretica]|uniref:Uncharacterized protein n=1 Tax=Brassica cretica TaxID=69181 RepID=A0ABQ7CNY4_BRACR|nr:hypothetical protein DY000_02019248 [Brassica cretica]
MVRASLSATPEGPRGLSNTTPDRVPATQRLGTSPYHPPINSGNSLEGQANSFKRISATLRLRPQTLPHEGDKEATAIAPTKGSGERHASSTTIGPVCKCTN